MINLEYRTEDMMCLECQEKFSFLDMVPEPDTGNPEDVEFYLCPYCHNDNIDMIDYLF